MPACSSTAATFKMPSVMKTRSSNKKIEGGVIRQTRLIISVPSSPHLGADVQEILSPPLARMVLQQVRATFRGDGCALRVLMQIMPDPFLQIAEIRPAIHRMPPIHEIVRDQGLRPVRQEHGAHRDDLEIPERGRQPASTQRHGDL